MRTIIGAIVVIITAVLQMVGIELSDADRDGLINSLVIIIGGLWIIYSRYEATRNLKTGGLLKPAEPLVKETKD